MHPNDPRNNPKHRERGPKRFEYGYADIAHVAGTSEANVRAHVYKGDLDPEDLASVLRFAFRRWKENQASEAKEPEPVSSTAPRRT